MSNVDALVNEIMGHESSDGSFNACIQQALEINYPGDKDKQRAELTKALETFMDTTVNNMLTTMQTAAASSSIYWRLIAALELPIPVKLTVVPDTD